MTKKFRTLLNNKKEIIRHLDRWSEVEAKEYNKESKIMKKIKMYPIVCPSCKGKGFIPNKSDMSSNAKETCPACNGAKTITCTEEIDD
jgi:DnaJ-class molecular chaperone